MSLWELIRTSSNNWIQSCFWAWERMVQLWFAVALTGIIPYHTVGALQKKAQGSWSGGVKRLSACSLPGDADDAIYCKRYSEVRSPKNDNFDPKSFSIEVLPIAYLMSACPRRLFFPPPAVIRLTSLRARKLAGAGHDCELESYLELAWPQDQVKFQIKTEGSLEVKLPTIWTDGKTEVGRVTEKRKKKEDIREVARRAFWSQLRKIVGFGALLEVEMFKKCTPVSRTFRGKNAQNTRFGALLRVEMFKKWTPLWRDISKSKCSKHHILGPLLDVEMSKNSARLWPEAHAEVKMWKALQVWTTLLLLLLQLQLQLKLQLQLQPKIQVQLHLLTTATSKTTTTTATTTTITATATSTTKPKT